MKQASIRGCEIDFAVLDGGRGNNPGTFVVIGPALLAGGCIHGIELGITATEIHHSIHHRGGRLNANLIVNHRVFARLEAPDFFPARRVESIKIAVPAANKQSASRDCWRSMNNITRLELPFQVAGGGVQRIDIGVPAAKENSSVPDDRRGKIEIEGVRHRLGSRLRAMEVFCGEAAFALSLELPLEIAGGCIDCIKVAIKAAKIDDSCQDSGR